MKTIFDLILAKQPWIVRWTCYCFVALMVAIGSAFVAGWKLAPQAEAYFDSRIEKWVAPKIIMHDLQFSALHDKFDSQQTHFDKRLNSMDEKLNILIGRKY